ncbi:hypothetical protein [Lunatibacter salilacus]|uniref:hypothetical protein n=1 Tax=Lunatibacter salilacus TaxID=2483804 RepID=UPI00131DEF89|nr:hypothetical protein [Lunatibacter salilacus]
MAEIVAPGFNPGVKKQRPIAPFWPQSGQFLITLSRQNPVDGWSAIMLSEPTLFSSRQYAHKSGIDQISINR